MLGLTLAALMTAVVSGKDLDPESVKFLGECRYILTEMEQDMFDALPTPERRAEFIKNFWKGLDPNPLTEVNEYRDLYYQRLEEANRLFTRGKAGYLTDRGKVYMLMGPPDEKEAHAVGRRSDEKPSEVWIYRSAKHRGLSRDAEIAFIDDTGTGNFRISSRAALDAGEARTQQVHAMAGDLAALKASAMMQVNPRDGGTGGTPQSLQAQAPPTPSPSAGSGGSTSSATAPDWKIGVTPRYDFFKASEGKTLLAMTVALDRATASGSADGYKVFAKIETKVPDPLVPSRDLKDQFKSEESDRQLIYQAQTPLAPGEYRVLYGVTDVGLGTTKAFEDALVVPAYDDTKLSLSSIVAAVKMEEAKAPESPVDPAAAPTGPTLTPFELSGTRVVPCVDGRYGKKDELSLYYQIYGATPAASGKPVLDIKYLIHRKQDDGKWKAVGQMPLPGQSELVQEYVLPLSDLRQGAGDYKVEVTIKDTTGGQTAKGETPFTVK